MALQNYYKRYSKNLYNILGLVFIFSMLDFIFSGARYMQYGLSILLVLMFLQRIPKKGPIKRVFVLFILFFLVLLFRGLYLDNYIKYFINDIYVWSFFVFVLFFGSENSLKESKLKIPELFAKLLIVALPFSILIFFKYGQLSSDIVTRSLVSDDINAKALFNPIIFAPLLMPFIFDLKKYLRVIVILSNIFLFVFGILAATRVVMVVPLLGFISLIFQFKNIPFRKSFSVVLGLIFFIGILMVFLPEDQTSFFSDKLDYTFSRFESTDISSGRNSEVEGLFDEYSLSEFILGRGAGGSQSFGFWKDIGTIDNLGTPLAHYGFLHLILKGGFPLLFFVYGLAIWSMINLYKRGDKQFLFVILIYLTYEVSHTKFNDPFYVIFLWLSISYSLQLKSQNMRITKTGNLISNNK